MIKSKIKPLKELKEIVSKLKKKKKTIVFTNGCFDLIHTGHVVYLDMAKKKGDFLIVAVNSDASVKRLKGKNRPITNECERSMVLAALESVDFVTIFNEDTPASIIEEIEPDVLIKGADWKIPDIAGAETVKKSGGKVVTVPFYKGCSTTSLIKKIKELR